MSYANIVCNTISLSSSTASNVADGFLVSNGNIRIVGSPAQVLISSDSGSTFGNLTLPTDGRFYGMYYQDGYYVAAGANTASNSATVWYSNNTSTWTPVASYVSQDPSLRANAAFTWTSYNGNCFVVGGPGVRPYRNLTAGNLTAWNDLASISNTDRTRFDAQIVSAVWGGNGRAMMGAIGEGAAGLYSEYLFAIKSNNSFSYNSLNSNWYGSATASADFTTDVIYSIPDDRFIMTANAGTIVTHDWTSNTSILGSNNTSMYISPESDALPGAIYSLRGYRVQDNVSVYTTNIASDLTSIAHHNGLYYVTAKDSNAIYYSPDFVSTWQSVSVASAGNEPIVRLRSDGTNLYGFSNTGRLYQLIIGPDTPNIVSVPSTPITISAGAIETGLFCRIQCDYYRATPEATPHSEVLTFSDYNLPVYINSELYQPLGTLLSVSSSTSELRNSSAGITVGLSGIPNASIAEIVNSRFKGSPIEVWRIIFDAETKAQIAVTGRFQGLVNNYALEEEYDSASSVASNRILLTCASTTEVLSNKVAGRRTNPIDQRELYPDDLSMDRVISLANSNFNFGAVIR